MRLRRTAVTAVTAVLVLSGTPRAAAGAVDVEAVAAQASGLTITGAVTVTPIPAVGMAAGEASPPGALGPVSDAVASYSLAGLFSSNLMVVGASAGGLAGDSPAGFVEARSAVQGVTTFFGSGSASASVVGAACRASGEDISGVTVIEDGVLLGQPVSPSPAPNTVVALPNGTVTFNEQQVQADGAASVIVVNAIHARLEFGGLAGASPSVDAIIGSVRCQVALSATPAPPTTLPPGATTVPPSPTTTRSPVAPPADTQPRTGSPDVLALGLLLVVAALGLRSATGGRPFRRGGSAGRWSAAEPRW